MTLAAEGETASAESRERRGVAGEPRRSWASHQPFELRGTPYNDEAVRARRWMRVAKTYQWRTVALDVLASSAVLAAFLVIQRSSEALTLAFYGSTVVAFVALVALARGYEQRNLGDGPGEFQSVARAGFYAMALIMAASYATKADVSRQFVFLEIPLVVGASVVVRYVHRRFLHRARSRGEWMKRTLVVGDIGGVYRVARDLGRASHHGYEVTGVCLPEFQRGRQVAGVPVIGAVADVPQVAADRAVDVVVVAGPSLSGDALRRLSWALDRVGAQLIVVPDLVEVDGPRLALRPAAGLSLLEVEVGAPRRRLVGKAVFDRVVGSLLLAVAAPIIGVSALAVRLTSPGRPFYRQTRVGVDGQIFTMYKIRSMYIDADARRADLAALNEAGGVLFKMRNDPRVTPVGRFLRRYSLDELPQLWNVVRGDMSLVGPRPPLGEEVAKYEDAAHRRLRVKPGLTGLWQVSGRSNLSGEESVRLDLRYVDNWSLTMDVMILWKTARAVVGAAGAY